MPTAPFVLALDQGGHASRALVFDGTGSVIARAETVIDTDEPAPDRVEHDADALAASVRDAARTVLEALGPDARRVTCAGLATQRSSVVCWDRVTGAALSPVLSWRDRRAADLLGRAVRSADHARRVRALTGLVPTPHAGATKLRWCLDALPAVTDAARTARLACGPLASFLLARLLREHPLVVDPVNASRTLLYDIRRGDWSPELLERFGVPAACLPACVQDGHVYGTLALDAPGLPDVPLVYCTGDQPAAAHADGPPDPDTAFVNMGTGAFVLRPVGAVPVGEPGLLCSVLKRDASGPLFALEGTVNGAGSALASVGHDIGLDPAAAFARADVALGRAAVSGESIFLNGVGGLGAPWWVPDFPSRFVGAGDTGARLAAVLESVVFLLAVNLDRMAASTGAPDRIMVSGGLSASAGVCRRLSTLTERPVERADDHEATARGVAFSAAGAPAAWLPRPRGDRVDPTPDPALARRFARWRRAMDCAVARCTG